MTRRSIVAIGVFAVLFVFSAYVCDDAFITFRTADNFVRGHGLRWNVAERVQVFTSPSFALLFSAAYAVVRDPGDLPNPARAYWLVLAISFLFSVWTIRHLVKTHTRGESAWILLALLMSSQAFVTFTSSGLETPLIYVLVAVLFAGWLRRDPQTPREYGWLFLSAGLALLTRLDLALLVGPVAAHLGVTGIRRFGRRIAGPMLAGALPVALWHAFSLCYYGFLLPNSYYAKLGIDAPAPVLWSMGRYYIAESLRQDPVTAATCAAALVACLTNLRTCLAGVGVGLSLLYIVSIGGDFLGFRFLTAPFLVSAMILVRRLETWNAAPQRLWIGVVAAAMVYSSVVRASPLRAIREGPRAPDVEYYYPASGLARWRPGVPFPFARFLQVDSLADCQQRRVAVPVVAIGGDGLNGFCRGPNAFLIDPHGITDPLIARLSLPVAKPFKPGHIWKPVPAGYIESAAAAGNAMVDKDLAVFYERLRVVVSGPLWTKERWRSIWLLNFTDAARYRRPYLN